MEYFKSGLKTVLGAQPGVNQPTGAETVERLVERVQTSTLLDDRRDACRALKSLSKKFRLEVGAQGMDALIRVLETDQSDAEIVGYALETLTNVIAGPQDDEDFSFEINSQESENLGIQFTDIYIKRNENVALLLDLLEEHDFKVRWPTVKLLTGLLVSKAKELQECILVNPMGVSRLMDLLSDSREIIRNDALLLLGHLTKGNANIQKIVAFENAFDKILDIIEEEGFSDGGVIVEDCLLVLLNLLKSNISNQNFFKEGSYIQKLAPFFDLQNDPSNSLAAETKGWSPQKVSNIHLMLQLVRTLVSPNNPLQVISSCQKVMNQCGLLELLCSILMANGVPADILTEDINTVAEVIRGSHGNQEHFAAVNAPSNPPSPAIVVLLMSMVNEKQPFVLRCGVLYCFQSFLYRNELGQAQVIQTLLPTSTNMPQVTAGQLLCGGLFSVDSLSNWFAAVALSHALVDNNTQKEQLLRVQLATSVGNPPISLLKQCTTILQQGGKVQTRLGLLILLCTLLSNCSLAVSHFLSIPTNVPYLTSQVGLAEGDENEDLVQGICSLALGICIEYNDDSVPSFSKESLCQIIVKRIGLEMFLGKLSAVTKHERYSQAAQKPHPKYKQAHDVLLDYEFCRLFKSLEGTVIKAVQPRPKGLPNGPESNMSAEQHALLQQYKELIRVQDQELQELRRNFEDLRQEHEKSAEQLSETSSTIQQLRDQNALFKAQRVAVSAAAAAASSSSSPATKSLLEGDDASKNVEEEKEALQKQLQTIERLEAENEKLKEELQLSLLLQSNKKLPVNEPIRSDLSTENGFQENKRGDQEEEERLRREVQTGQERIAQLTKQVSLLEEQAEEDKRRRTNDEPQQSQRLEKEISELQSEKEVAKLDLENLRKEQEDLLVLLTEQDTKICLYKQQIKSLGGKIEDDDELDDDDDEDDDDSLPLEE